MSIRLRIALLSTCLMALLLAAIGTGVYFTMKRSLSAEMDNRLQNVAKGIGEEKDPIASYSLFTGKLHRSTDFGPFASPGLLIQLTNPDGSEADKSWLGDPLQLTDEMLKKNLNQEWVYVTTEVNGFPVRLLSIPLTDEESGTKFRGTLQIAEPMTQMQNTLSKLRLLLLAALGLGTAVTAIGSYAMAGHSLRPLSRITTTAHLIGRSRDLSQRIDPPETGDEVQTLAETFNQMLVRLESAFAAERRFVSDASHELRTPLTALRGNAEILLRQLEFGDAHPDELRDVLTDIRDEAERMGRLVQNLLTLARADVGWRPEMESIHLDHIAGDAARVAAPLTGNHRFEVQIDSEVDVVGNSDLLKQLLLILLDNAFTYTPDDAMVALNVQRGERDAELVVRDTGPGISPDQLDRIFDRFYRGDAARTRRTGGAGLGLAIARWIVECHDGSIDVESAPEEGTTFTVRLPLAEHVDEAPMRPRHAPVRRHAQVREQAPVASQ